jgi:hypothetical protein
MTKTSGGIKLDIDDDGNVYTVNEDDSNQNEKCLADMRCPHAKRNLNNKHISITCHLKKPKIIDVFTLDKCPDNKWHRYVDVRGPQDLIRAINKTGCYMCGGQKQWRLKPSKDNKNPPWICSTCHPACALIDNKIETRKYKPKI